MGYALDAQLNWKWEAYSLMLGVEHGQTQSVLGENVTRDKGRMQLTYGFTERLYGGLGGSYLMSESDGFISRTRTNQYTISPNVRYALNEYADVVVGWERLEYHNELSHSTMNSDRIFAKFSIAIPETF
jgi:hypothetical protein